MLAAVCVGVAVVSGVSAVRGPAPATTSVLVATRDLPAGSVVEPGDVRRADYPTSLVPSGLLDTAEGQVLAGPIRRGEPLTAARTVGADLTEPGVVATPVRLPDSAMAGLLSLGDVVDLSVVDPADDEPALPLAHDVRVLALPGGADEADSGASWQDAGLGGRLVVLGLEPDDVPSVTAAAVRAFVVFTWSDATVSR